MNPLNKTFIGLVTAALIGGATQLEGVKYTPYMDVGGVPTVCMGNTKGVILGKTYTPEECNAMLKRDLAEHGKGILACINQPIDVNQYNAFTLMAYNIGVANFCSSRTVKLLNEGKDRQTVCDAMANGPDGKPVWSYVKKDGVLVFYKGLYNRRLYERSMCKGEAYAG